MRIADMPPFAYFDWLTVRVTTGRETCPDCGLAPRSAFNQGDGRYALWCSNDHRWEVSRVLPYPDDDLLKICMRCGRKTDFTRDADGELHSSCCGWPGVAADRDPT